MCNTGFVALFGSIQELQLYNVYCNDEDFQEQSKAMQVQVFYEVPICAHAKNRIADLSRRNPVRHMAICFWLQRLDGSVGHGMVSSVPMCRLGPHRDWPARTQPSR